MATPSSTPNAATLVRSRRTIIVIGVILPVAIAIAGSFVMALWIPELPNPVASHWSASGPDGYTTVGSIIAIPLASTLLFSTLVAILSWRGGPQGGLLSVHKLLIVTAVFISTLLTVTSTGSLAIQRGLNSATQTGDIGGILVGAFAAAIALASLSWLVLPPGERVASSSKVAEPIAAASIERLYFSTTTRLGMPIVVIMVLVSLALAITLIVHAINRPDEISTPTMIALLALALAAATLSWRVTIDERGIRVRSAFGWPRVYIKAEDISSVALVELDPLGEFGGYGWRWDAQGRSGVVLSRGEAIEVTRVNGKRFVVTVHDAARGAAILATVQKAAGKGGHGKKRRPKNK